MDSTIVSITDLSGRTANADYKDCREPSDKDLIAIILDKQLGNEVKVTITNVLGNKEKFQAVLKDGKLARYNLTQDTKGYRKLYKAAVMAELERLKQYEKISKETCRQYVQGKVKEQEVQALVDKRKSGIWAAIPDTYDTAMYVCATIDLIVEKVDNGII